MPFLLEKIDAQIAGWMEHYGHALHRYSLGVFFIWLGVLKTFGVSTATSLIAHVVYWGEPETMVPILGWWEVAIGICLLFRPLIRIALFLLAIRLPGSLLALILLPDICFFHVPYAPTPEGQYLIKDILLFSAALVIGGTVRIELEGRRL
jgi:uncharacterized membrane protein YkgB